jgi:hypothetical protein
MYVGMSKTGIGRPTSQAHHVLGGLQIADTDQLHVYPMPSEEAARDVERALIVRLQPAWNSKRMLSASLASTLGLRRNSAGVLARRIRDESNPDATTDKVHYVRVVQPGEYADVLAAPPVCSAALR